MSQTRNLTTTRRQVFGEVEPGTECRICGRAVEDGRSKTCSDYCDNLQTAVMGMLNWSSVRRRVLERDSETCQACGFDMARERLARDHIKARIREQLEETPDAPSALELGRGDSEDYGWETHREKMRERREQRAELKARYGDPYEYSQTLEVDHITPIADGGHPFDPGNLQTLCEDCHTEKTATENSERPQTPSRGDMSQSLFEYVADGGEGAIR